MHFYVMTLFPRCDVHFDVMAYFLKCLCTLCTFHAMTYILRNDVLFVVMAYFCRQ